MPAYDGQWFSPPAPMALVALRHTETLSHVAVLLDGPAQVWGEHCSP